MPPDTWPVADNTTLIVSGRPDVWYIRCGPNPVNFSQWRAIGQNKVSTVSPRTKHWPTRCETPQDGLESSENDLTAPPHNQVFRCYGLPSGLVVAVACVNSAYAAHTACVQPVSH